MTPQVGAQIWGVMEIEQGAPGVIPLLVQA